MEAEYFFETFLSACKATWYHNLDCSIELDIIFFIGGVELSS
jgi:hypothetical protein